MSKRIVIALGGNALGNTPYEQLALVTETAKPIVDLIAQGNEVIIAHGNGPQVGMINLGMATAECGAMSQGYIGYHLQNAIGNELASRGMNKDVATVVTQVLVDEADPAFQHPTKPVGAFYDKETADRIAAEKGYTMVEDAGRGYRQVVPSPKPVDVIEKNVVNDLIGAGVVVITVGHRQGLCLREAGRAREGRRAGYLDGGRSRRHQLGQAQPGVPGEDEHRRGRKVLRRRPLCPRLHAAEGQGCHLLRPVWRQGDHRLPGERRQGRQGRIRHDGLPLIACQKNLDAHKREKRIKTRAWLWLGACFGIRRRKMLLTDQILDAIIKIALENHLKLHKRAIRPAA